MRVGASISPNWMEVLDTMYKKVRVSPKYFMPMMDSGFRAPAKKQFEIALDHYKNDGTPYNFDADRCAGAGCDKAQDELAEGVKLMKCGKCKLISYCCRGCQEKD